MFILLFNYILSFYICTVDHVFHLLQMHEGTNLLLLGSGVVNYCLPSKY